METARISFTDFLHDLNTGAECDRQALVDRFMSAVTSAPLIEKDLFAHFIFRGDAGSVTIPCDANDWNPAEFAMTRINGTNFWYYTHRFEPDARLDYKFVINDSDWILDPLNHRQIEGGFGMNSELRMPWYALPQELRQHPEIQCGTITTTEYYSAVLGNTREIKVYTPAGYHCAGGQYPLVLFHDGLDFLSLGSAATTLDFLIARHRMEPVIAVFVPPVDRNAEYAGVRMSLYDTFIVDELLPFIDRTYRTKPVAAERATIGASNGGNIALWLGLHYPETFGKIAALSSNVVSAVSGGYEHTPRLSIRFFFDMGTYDIQPLVPVMKNFISLLASKGYTYRYRRYNEGHSWGNWKAHVGRALEWFFPPSAGFIGRSLKLPRQQPFSRSVTP